MRRLISIICIFILPAYSYGQLYSMSDHYVYNSLAINPAYAGSHNALSTIFGYRTCLNSFEGAPSTMTLSVHSSLNNDKIGMGLFVMDDKYGISNEMSFIGNYAYRMNIGYGKLALGIGLGMIVNKTQWNALEARDADDELLAENNSAGTLPDFSLGMYYSTNKYFIGLSLPLFLSHEYSSQTEKYTIKNDFKEYNYFFNTGYIFDINQNIKFFPSFLIRYNQGNAPQVDLTSQFIFKDIVWIGAQYRSRNVLVGMLQCQITKQIRVAYSYDYSVGRSDRYKFSSHEIMFNYVLAHKVVVESPRHF
jgi:type IX secretion system PorP/SprF family membrane protein